MINEELEKQRILDEAAEILGKQAAKSIMDYAAKVITMTKAKNVKITFDCSRCGMVSVSDVQSVICQGYYQSYNDVKIWVECPKCSEFFYLVS